MDELKVVNAGLCGQLKDMKAKGDAANAEMNRLKLEKAELAEALVRCAVGVWNAAGM